MHEACSGCQNSLRSHVLPIWRVSQRINGMRSVEVSNEIVRLIQRVCFDIIAARFRFKAECGAEGGSARRPSKEFSEDEACGCG